MKQQDKIKSYKPLPVWILVDALQDTVHKESSKKSKLVRAYKSKG